MSTGLTSEDLSLSFCEWAEQGGYKELVARSTISSIQGMSLRAGTNNHIKMQYSECTPRKKNRRSSCLLSTYPRIDLET
jgi:hypothetical protein